MFHKVLPGPLLARDPLRILYCKRPPTVSDHSVFAFWVVAYGRIKYLEIFSSEDCDSVHPLVQLLWHDIRCIGNDFFQFSYYIRYCWFSHDVTKIQTTKLSILLRFYFHGVLEQLKTNFFCKFSLQKGSWFCNIVRLNF